MDVYKRNKDLTRFKKKKSSFLADWRKIKLSLKWIWDLTWIQGRFKLQSHKALKHAELLQTTQHCKAYCLPVPRVNMMSENQCEVWPRLKTWPLSLHTRNLSCINHFNHIYTQNLYQVATGFQKNLPINIHIKNVISQTNSVHLHVTFMNE